MKQHRRDDLLQVKGILELAVTIQEKLWNSSDIYKNEEFTLMGRYLQRALHIIKWVGEEEDLGTVAYQHLDLSDTEEELHLASAIQENLWDSSDLYRNDEFEKLRSQTNWARLFHSLWA